jgi:surfactin synthase thioesterase subunit
MHNLIENSKLKVFDGDHYFFLKNAKDISNAIS